MRRSIIMKTVAFIMCVITLAVAVISAFGIIAMTSKKFYTRSYEEIRNDLLSDILYEYSHEAAVAHHYGTVDRIDRLEGRNFYYVIYDGDMKVVASNYNGEDTKHSESFTIYVEEWIDDPTLPPDASVDTSFYGEIDSDVATETYDPAAVTGDYNGALSIDTGEPLDTGFYGHPELTGRYVTILYTVVSHIPAEYFTTDKLSFGESLLDLAYSMRNAAWFICGGALLLFVIFLVILCCCAGWKKGEEKPKTSLFDKIPFDIFTLLYAFLISVGVNCFAEFYFEGFELAIAKVIASILGSVLLVGYIFSFAARAKTGELFKNTLIWLVIRGIFRFFRALALGIGKLMADMPSFIKLIIFIVLVLVWVVLMISAAFSYMLETALILLLIGGTILALFASYITYGFSKVRSGSERIAGGDIGHRIDTSHMPSDIKRHAESINNIRSGLEGALDERLKSERFKTELITNVSHDLKTPLTSIVNYVDLLKGEMAKEEKDEGRIDEYIEVLERQSQRLKKLTEDLVEASKASTGNLEISPATIELGEMISQIEGEYSEKLTNAGLEPIIRLPGSPLCIMADGRHLWRVFDNLMNNVIKYSQCGTRVYIEASRHMDRAYVIFRNTSKYELRISGEELTERFVRGDASRHTEGSGLGLSIARSLTELSGGRLDIYTDGDLFKVVLGFELVKNEPSQNGVNNENETQNNR